VFATWRPYNEELATPRDGRSTPIGQFETNNQHIEKTQWSSDSQTSVSLTITNNNLAQHSGQHTDKHRSVTDHQPTHRHNIAVNTLTQHSGQHTDKHRSVTDYQPTQRHNIAVNLLKNIGQTRTTINT